MLAPNSRAVRGFRGKMKQPMSNPMIASGDAPTERRHVVVCGPSAGFRSEISVGPHQQVADEPHDVGGGDEGPTPYEYLLSALGTCTVMTLRLYADRKKWPLEHAVCRLHHFKRHVNDCRDCDDGKRAFLDHVECEIELFGPLSADQRARLLEIAGKCPVHRTLSSEVRIHSVLVDSAPSGEENA